MGLYFCTNITDATADPKTIYVGDIPQAGTITIRPGQTIDLEILATRNQILESRQLKAHFNEGRITIDTLGTQPTDRIFVDATVSGFNIGNVSIDSALPISVDINGVATPVSGVTNNGNTYLDVNENLPSNPTVQNLTISTANTEVPAILPIDSKRFLVKVRTSDATVNLAFASGGDYITVREGVAFSEENVDAGNVTLYLMIDKAPRVVEILSWA